MKKFLSWNGSFTNAQFNSPLLLLLFLTTSECPRELKQWATRGKIDKELIAETFSTCWVEPLNETIHTRTVFHWSIWFHCNIIDLMLHLNTSTLPDGSATMCGLETDSQLLLFHFQFLRPYDRFGLIDFYVRVLLCSLYAYEPIIKILHACGVNSYEM